MVRFEKNKIMNSKPNLLVIECRKLIKADEKAIAKYRIAEDIKQWPKY